MKMISTALVPLALLAIPALAQQADRPALSGKVTIQVTPAKSAAEQAQPQTSETLTIDVVPRNPANAQSQTGETLTIRILPRKQANGQAQAEATETTTVEVVEQRQAEGAPQPQTSQPLTVQFVNPAPPADDSEEAELRDLERCDAKWNAKLQAYKEELAQTKDYRTYFAKWEDSPAQRPPKLPLPPLTRASYRACMSECLHEAGAVCPGGWPEEKK